MALVKERIFEVNQKLEIVIQRANEKEAHSYTSRVEEVGNDFLVIAMPMHKSIPVILSPKEEFRGKVFAHGVPYEFKSIFFSKKAGQIPTWKISYPTEMRKIQLREFVRVPVRLPLEITFYKKTEKDEEPQKIVYETVTKDLSGGGLRFIFYEHLPVGTSIGIKIILPKSEEEEEQELLAVAKVMRCEEQVTEGRDERIFMVGTKFFKLPEVQRKLIIKLVYDQQIEWRKRGLQ